MSAGLSNNISSTSVFLLTGFPGLEHLHSWIFVPFCSLYAVAILGNYTILFVIKTEQDLHQPMYYFLSMLATTDLGLALSTLPTMLCVFWFNSREISFDACLVQMFFIHAFSFMESSVLLAMAFDRFVAICSPLRYASILTGERCAKVGLVIVCRCTLLLFPLIGLLTLLPFCRSHVLSHSYCLHQDIIRLACTDTTLNSMYGLTLVLLIVILDPLLIILSYVLILKAVLSIASKAERAKALNTCVSHICAVLIFYIPMVGLSMIHRFGKDTAPVIHILMANIYLFVPPVLNPIIYSIKTKQIRKGVLRLLCQKRASPGHHL
ncbi:olfactory receptor, family 51, subfamily M, member 1 [Alligator mississippiensis]|uniref:Olfactory receptor n=1 Tax=Alligator mississippiensis TaxID=8496 RepID=A0A151PG36_ALLMI|nr:olfactory receptor, family 51, subfamily M, member 1 [Alligator mississippiensis]